MSKQLTRIDGARDLIRSVLHGRLNNTARDHLHRALEHIAEAWLAEDGQNARSVEILAKVSGSTQRLLTRMADGQTKSL